MMIQNNLMTAGRTETRRRALTWLATAATVACFAMAPANDVNAEEWPSRPIKVVVPYGAGGLTDLMARVTTARLSEALGQPFVIENRPGALGSIGTQYAISSPPDGYTLYFAAGAQLLAVPFMHKVNYDPLTQLAPIGIVGFNGFVLGLNRRCRSNPSASCSAYMRADPGKVNYAIAQVGTVSQLLPALIAAQQSLDIVGVPFTSGPAALTGVVQGSVQMLFGNPSDVLPAAADGRIKLVAVSSPERLPQIPDVPTLSESIPGFSFTAWNGYFAPSATPKPILDRLAAEVEKLGRDPAVTKRFAEMGITAKTTTSAETAAIIQRELPMYETAIKASGLQKQ